MGTAIQLQVGDVVRLIGQERGKRILSLSSSFVELEQPAGIVSRRTLEAWIAEGRVEHFVDLGRQPSSNLCGCLHRASVHFGGRDVNGGPIAGCNGRDDSGEACCCEGFHAYVSVERLERPSDEDAPATRSISRSDQIVTAFAEALLEQQS